MAEPTVNIGLHFAFFCLQNVAVSKSHHRLLFHLIMEKEKEQKKHFSRYSEYGGYIMEMEGVTTLSISSFLWALRCLAHLKNTLCFFCAF